MVSSLSFLLRQLWPVGVPEPDSDLSGLTAVVTGATSGLGYATAEHLVKHRVATLVIGCKDFDKGAEVKQSLSSLAPEGKTEIHVWNLDLASFDSVIAFHKQVQQLENIHIFISAARHTPGEDWKFTQDGFEHSLQVNVLGTGMLAHLILGDMAKTADAPEVLKKPQMVLLSSDDHYDVDFVQKDAEKLLQALNDPFSYRSTDSRPRELSRLADLLTIFIAKELALLPAATNVNVNVCCPGFCKTPAFDQQRTKMPWYVSYMLGVVAWTPTYGARTIVWSATTHTTPGAYIQDCMEVEPLDFVSTEKGQDVQKQVWQEMVKLWIKKDADIRLIEASAA